ncbi:MAG TPA: hypothetical protein VL651_07235 [Bacteroidia bacterium]|jgi:hypothetical protein|nr:hypothetical protein [Bacteroidia bacterium]
MKVQLLCSITILVVACNSGKDSKSENVVTAKKRIKSQTEYYYSSVSDTINLKRNISDKLEFDTSGKMIEQTNYDAGNESQRFHYSYDASGQANRIEVYRGTEDLIDYIDSIVSLQDAGSGSVKTYRFFKHGQPSTRMDQRRFQPMLYEFRYTFDSVSHVEHEENFVDGKLLNTINKLQLKKVKPGTATHADSISYVQYFDDKDSLLQTDDYSPGYYPSSTMIVRDSTGRRTAVFFRSPQKKENDQHWFFYYNEYGFVKREITYDNNGFITDVHDFEYTFY